MKARFLSLISPSQPLALTKGFFCGFFYDLWRLERKFFPIFTHKVTLCIRDKIQNTEVSVKLCCLIKSNATFLVWVGKAWKYFQVPDKIFLSLIYWVHKQWTHFLLKWTKYQFVTRVFKFLGFYIPKFILFIKQEILFLLSWVTQFQTWKLTPQYFKYQIFSIYFYILFI